MATGVGIDLLEIERMERALERHPRLAERIFTERRARVRGRAPARDAIWRHASPPRRRSSRRSA